MTDVTPAKAGVFKDSGLRRNDMPKHLSGNYESY